jgi:hypothetical protein
MKHLKEMKANQTIITGDIDPLDPNRQMLRKYSLEEVTPERVGKAIYHSLTPEQKRQFQIDAQYESRGMDNNGYLEQLTKLKTNQISELQDNIARIEKQKIIAQNNNQDTKPFDDYIASATSEINIITNQLKSPEGMAKESLESADYLKLYKYQNQMADSYKNIFAYKKVSDTGTVVSGNKNSDGSGNDKSSTSSSEKGMLPLDEYGEIDWSKQVNWAINPDKNGDQSVLKSKNELLIQGKNLNNKLIVAKENVYHDMNLDPAFSALTPAEKDLKFKEYENKWRRLDTKGIPIPILNYFNNTNEIRETQSLLSQTLLDNQNKLNAMPEYKKATAGLSASQKFLKPTYQVDLAYDSHYPIGTTKKVYSKEAIATFTNALTLTNQRTNIPKAYPMGMTGWASTKVASGIVEHFSTLDLKPLPLTGSNDELIIDINKQIETANKLNQENFNKNPGFVNALGKITQLGKNPYEVKNPLFALANSNPEIREHLSTYNAYQKTVNELEGKVYSESGIELLIPTFTFPNDKPTQDRYINQFRELHRHNGEHKDKDIKTITSLTSKLDGTLELGYIVDNGTDSGEIAKTVVTRTQAGSLSKLLPPDNDRLLMDMLTKNGKTTNDVAKAPRFIVGDESIPYQIGKLSNGKLKVYFFDANHVPIVNWTSTEFDDIYQLKKAGQRIATDLLLKQKQQQQQTN